MVEKAKLGNLTPDVFPSKISFLVNMLSTAGIKNACFMQGLIAGDFN